MKKLVVLLSVLFLPGCSKSSPQLTSANPPTLMDYFRAEGEKSCQHKNKNIEKLYEDTVFYCFGDNQMLGVPINDPLLKNGGFRMLIRFGPDVEKGLFLQLVESESNGSVGMTLNPNVIQDQGVQWKVAVGYNDGSQYKVAGLGIDPLPPNRRSERSPSSALPLVQGMILKTGEDGVIWLWFVYSDPIETRSYRLESVRNTTRKEFGQDYLLNK